MEECYILLVNSWSKNSYSDAFIIKLYSNGTVDNSFGNNGKITFNNLASGNGNYKGSAIEVFTNTNIYPEEEVYLFGNSSKNLCFD